MDTLSCRNHRPPRTARTEIVAPKPPRRHFSPADKLRIVREAQAATQPGQIEAILRREGIYSSYLTSWRKEIEQHGVQGLKGKRPGRKVKKDDKDLRIEALEKKAARLAHELEVAQKLISLQKKVSELLGVTLPKPEE